MAEPSWKPGAELGGYVLERVLGRGDMGVVWAARHSQSGEPYTLYHLFPEGPDPLWQPGVEPGGLRASARVEGRPPLAMLSIGPHRAKSATGGSLRGSARFADGRLLSAKLEQEVRLAVGGATLKLTATLQPLGD